MNKLVSVRVPSICICFTLITIANSALQVLYSRGLDGYTASVLYLFLWLIICQLIDAVVCRIEFRKWSHYCLTESLILYLATLVFCRIFYWNSLTLRQLAAYTAVFLLVDISIFTYFRKRQDMRAEEINELLHKREKG